MTSTKNAENLKKDLQKTVKKFRDALPDRIDWYGRTVRPEYPKAMLTGQQMVKGTATINFGRNCEKNHNALAEFASSDEFKAFCEKHSVKVGPKEINADNRVQLRLYFQA
jgi:hypothetical protein